MIMEAGANIEAQDSQSCTLSSCRCRPAQFPRLGVVLLKHGAYVNAHDEDQDTPFHMVALQAGTHNAAELVDSLLRSGVDETILNDEARAASRGRCCG